MSKVYEMLKRNNKIETPWGVWRLFGEEAKEIEVCGNQVSFSLNGDFADLSEAREMVEFYAKQLGGVVKWDYTNKTKKKRTK